MQHFFQNGMQILLMTFLSNAYAGTIDFYHARSVDSLGKPYRFANDTLSNNFVENQII